ncbi:hypothetical protein F5Y19DRAFT_52435 [Xylariaceae sp. FL1651]|nr:hypothetical protein F5Y19DRAFT_52435 [Xylariaceae sp. FL1651]
MPTLFLRGPFVRPHLEAVRGLSRSHGRPGMRRKSQRQQSSASPTTSSSQAPNKPQQTQARTPIESQSHPHIQVKPQKKPEPKIEDHIPVPNTVAPLPFWQRLGPLTRAGQAYARAQRARPWRTQVLTTLFIYLCADFGAQQMNPSVGSIVDGNAGEADVEVSVSKERKHDWARTARSLVIGGTAAIPGYLWFTFLSRSFNYSSRVFSIAARVVVNQLTFTPLFNTYFFGSQALLSGDTPAEAWRRICHTVPVSFVNSCKLWPAVTAFSFAFIPFEYRSIFAGVIAVGWQTYLSFLNGRAERLEALRQREQFALSGVALERKSATPAPKLEREITSGGQGVPA